MKEITLESGKKVKLNDLTMLERQECEDVLIHRIHPDGSDELSGLARARNLWCMKGLGVDLEGLAGYSTEELSEISLAVRAASGEFGDPTGEDG